MPSTPSFPVAAEQRLLAAIVFTDVAGFSRRVEENESATLALLERDFVAMRLFSKAHSGTVIKSTGDGLMLYFTSAVEAVEWALKTQRHFAEQAAVLPTEEILRHRIGIHLGDVSISAGDVMGDGVNVAARVQAEARPGGICISQVVYGLVKNKMKLDVVRLEPRKLKNINEAVQMYHVLLEPPAPRTTESYRPTFEPAAPAAKTPVFSRGFILIAALTAGMVAAGIFFYQAHREHEKELAGSQQLRNALDAALQSGAKPGAAPTVVAPSRDAVTAAEPTSRPAAAIAPAEPDFLKMTTRTPAVAGVSPEHDGALPRAHECIRVLDTWRFQELQRYNKDRPLLVRPLRGTGQGWTLFTDANQQLAFAEGGAVRKRPWEELKPDLQAAIIASLLPNAPVPPPREVVRGAEAFAFVYGLPELAALLVRQ
jgi:class 3 adenylate cyclase